MRGQCGALGLEGRNYRDWRKVLVPQRPLERNKRENYRLHRQYYDYYREDPVLPRQLMKLAQAKDPQNTTLLMGFCKKEYDANGLASNEA